MRASSMPGLDIIAGMPRRKKAFDGLSMTDAELMAAALIGLERQRAEIGEKMAELRQRLDGGAGQAARKSAAVDSAAPVPKKRSMIAAAQRKRWAELKKAQAEEAAPVKKRKISAAGRKRIIAATKKRWAEFHAK